MVPDGMKNLEGSVDDLMGADNASDTSDEANKNQNQANQNNASPNPDLFPANNPVLRPPVAGHIGLWAKTDSTSYFKDYVVNSR